MNSKGTIKEYARRANALLRGWQRVLTQHQKETKGTPKYYEYNTKGIKNTMEGILNIAVSWHTQGMPKELEEYKRRLSTEY
eukprot:878679-Amphidinium_carterae.1